MRNNTIDKLLILCFAFYFNLNETSKAIYFIIAISYYLLHKNKNVEPNIYRKYATSALADGSQILAQRTAQRAAKEASSKMFIKAAKEAMEEAAEEAAEKAAKEMMEKAGKKAAKKAGKEAAEKASKKTAKKLVKEAGETAAKKAAAEGGDKAVQDAARKAAEEAAEAALKKTSRIDVVKKNAKWALGKCVENKKTCAGVAFAAYTGIRVATLKGEQKECLEYCNIQNKNNYIAKIDTERKFRDEESFSANPAFSHLNYSEIKQNVCNLENLENERNKAPEKLRDGTLRIKEEDGTNIECTSFCTEKCVPTWGKIIGQTIRSGVEEGTDIAAPIFNDIKNTGGDFLGDILEGLGIDLSAVWEYIQYGFIVIAIFCLIGCFFKFFG